MAVRYLVNVERFPGWEKTLAAGASTMGLPLEPEAVERFRLYAILLQKWGGRFNLTSRLEPEEIIALHFLDSLTLLAVRPPERGARLADIGSGAGFPGIPLAIVRPDLTVTLLESSAKKASFCAEVIHRLGLSNVAVIRGRVEDLPAAILPPAEHDWAAGRAAAPLPRLLELAAKIIHAEGTLAAYKGREEAQNPEALHPPPGWDFLGGDVVPVPGRPTPRALLFFRLL